MFAIISLLALLGTLTTIYLKYSYQYWSSKGVVQKNVVPIFGNMAAHVFRRKPIAHIFEDLYKMFPNKRYGGIYLLNLPSLLIRDPDVIKQLGVKDFDFFMNHGEFIGSGLDVAVDKSLFSLKGSKWRHMRGILSPSFTSSKIKQMFQPMSECGQRLASYFSNNPNESKYVHIQDFTTRYTNDNTASVTLSISCDSIKNRNNDFYNTVVEIADFTGVWKALKIFIGKTLPTLAKILQVKFFSKQVLNFFRNLIDDLIDQRQDANFKRQDMLQLLIDARQLNTNSNGPDTANFDITNEDITAQAIIFFFGGLDSVSQLMNFMAYELAINPDIQSRLQAEIDQVNDDCNGQVTYEALTQMKYMEMVVSETLRKYPPFVQFDRVCVAPYTIKPKFDDEKPVQLNKNDLLVFPIYALHHDEKYFPNPELFDPERFNDENKSKIKPYSYIPFGFGPRLCIGSRVALLETKILFYHILSKFNLEPTDRTQIPIQMEKGVFNLRAEKPIMLRFSKRLENCTK